MPTGCRPPPLRYSAHHRGLPCSPAHQRGCPFRPPRLRIRAPQAAGLCCSRGRPPPKLGPGVAAALRPGASLHSHSDRGLLAAMRPLPALDTRAVAPPGPPGPFPPVRHWSLPGLLTRCLRASRRPLGPARPLRPVRGPAGAPSRARQPVAPSARHGGPPTSVRSPPPTGRHTGLGTQALRPLPPAPSLHPQSYGLPLPSAWPPGSRHPWVSGG